MRPTPPEAPWINTVSPLSTSVEARACVAVAPATISPLASSKDNAAGLGTTDAVGTINSPAWALGTR
jgi:hypothetical protein